MKFFPLFHNIANKRCLIVGGGKVATRRARVLSRAGAIIDVISPNVLSELKALIEQSAGQYHPCCFEPELIRASYLCIVAATDCTKINRAVGDCAKQRHIAVNVVDDQRQCDVIFPSIIDREPLTIAVSNNGSSPVLSRLLKQQINQFVPDTYGSLSSFVGRHREKVKQVIGNEKARITFWENVLQGAIAEAIFSGKENEANRMLDTALAEPKVFNERGEVYLIGAGPGDPDLLTLRAFRLLQQAEVVLYDRLVSKEIMTLIRPESELIYVGKCRDKHTVEQHNINQLLVDHARLGKRVARLKGGDPFIFGRGGEEIEQLADQKIPFQVVPGITAANGCSAYAGIPLTHRDFAQSVQFVTGQLKNGTIDLDWQELIAPGKTLVFYMGLKSLPVICEALTAHGMKNDMPVALIEKGTTREQRVLVSSLQNLPLELQEKNIMSPSLFIVGEVVSLASTLHWFSG